MVVGFFFLKSPLRAGEETPLLPGTPQTSHRPEARKAPRRAVSGLSCRPLAPASPGPARCSATRLPRSALPPGPGGAD